MKYTQSAYIRELVAILESTGRLNNRKQQFQLKND